MKRLCDFLGYEPNRNKKWTAYYIQSSIMA